ncbi:glycosyl hydrolase family 28 protein [Coraliomargarita parva]|uniref:glycosyl hydrolase family 28 protein n=1 Tax=Coraliomargarita parva TaxID=3014050 RepID=UPI0022B46F01|nr:glycosyl hydrolase family 28 protein [Coraliomargarita parva]
MGYVDTEVSEGGGTVEVDWTVPTTVENGVEYDWLVYLTPDGWSNRYVSTGWTEGFSIVNVSVRGPEEAFAGQKIDVDFDYDSPESGMILRTIIKRVSDGVYIDYVDTVVDAGYGNLHMEYTLPASVDVGESYAWLAYLTPDSWSNRYASTGWTEPVEIVDLMTYPAPLGAPVTEDYTLSANGVPVDIYAGADYNGYKYGFCQFDFTGDVNIVITATGGISNPVVLPASLGITPVVDGDTISFDVSNAGQITVLPDGSSTDDALHLFANDPDLNPPNPNDANVLYMGPGMYGSVGRIDLADDETLYLAGGAFLQAGITMFGCENSRIAGRGILDGSCYSKGAGPTSYPIHISDSTDCTIEGITLRFAWGWTIVTWSSDGLVFSNLKICNGHMANDDGIDMINGTTNQTIENCFIRTDDDCIAFKGMSDGRSNLDGIEISSCVFWGDRARIFLLGHETRANYIMNITVADCDIIHYNEDSSVFLIEPGEQGTIGPNVLFEDIRAIGNPDNTSSFIQVQPTINHWMTVQLPGYVDGVSFKDITCLGEHGGQYIKLSGWNSTYVAQNVSFENIVVNDSVLTSTEPLIEVGPYTPNFSFYPYDGVPNSGTYYRIRNRLLDQYMYIDYYGDMDVTAYGNVTDDDLSSHWKFVEYDGYTRIINRLTERTLNLESRYEGESIDYVESTSIKSAAWTSHWELEDYDGVYTRIRNRWASTSRMHVSDQLGYVQCDTIDSSDTSSHWVIESVEE